MAYGDFSDLCERVSIPLCTLVSPLNQDPDSITFQGILPSCYSRSINVANTLIFQVGAAFIHIAILIIMQMIIYLVRQRYTAVGRKEMLFFFWCFIFFTLGSLIVDTGVAPPGSYAYSYFAAFQISMTGACCWSLMYAGLTGFNYWDDGSFLAMSILYCSTTFIFIANFAVALFTFNEGWSDILAPTKTIGLFTLLFVINGLFLLTYLITQLIVCCFLLVFSWWAVGSLFFSVFFFGSAGSLLYAFSKDICTSLNHYVDGTIFSTLSNMFAIMMVYKYWDVITFDDDEYYRHGEIVPGIGGGQREAEQLLK